MAARRILVVNPNASVEVTDRYVAEACLLAGPGVTIEGVTGRFGARIVSAEAEHAIAAHSALELIAEHAAGFDAVILAISFDSGLEAARQVLPLPVVGTTEAALAAARGRVGVVTFGAASRPLYERLLAGRALVGIETVEAATAADYLTPGAQDDAALAAVEALAARGAQAAAICGAALVGIARRLAPRASIPVHDGGAAVAAALAAPPVPHPIVRPLAGSVGLPPRLAALLDGSWSLEP